MKKILLFAIILIICNTVYSQTDNSGDLNFSEKSEQFDFYLSDPFPNPVKESAKIYFQLPVNETKANIVVYNILGNEIKRILVTEVDHSITINSINFEHGSYFYRLEFNDTKSPTKRMIIQ
ncbi:MAG: T9SS type A sorting domain-containing protein [Bacteroidota bacterium]